MKSVLVIALVASVLTGAELTAQSIEDIREGARVRLEVSGSKKPRTLVGILVSRTPDTLQLKLDRSNDLVTVPLDQARRLDVSLEQHSGAGRGAWSGFLLGATVGLAAGFSCDCGQPGLAGVTIGAILGGLGTGFGALIGMSGRVDEWTLVIPSPPRSGANRKMVPGGNSLLHLQF